MKRKFLITAYALFLALFFSVFSAAQEQNPDKKEDKKEADLIELTKLDKTIKLDIRYATANNFVGKPVYPEARAFLQRPAAEALLRVHKKLKEQGLGLVIFDGYRPWTITKMFWEVVSLEQRKFVADPAKGSKHNRGCAIDLSIYDLKTGALLDMPSGYDEFTERASPDYKGATILQTKNRELLRGLMESEGFTVNPNEWWHFDYKGWQDYGLYDVPFAKIRDAGELNGLVIRHVYFSGNEFTGDKTIRKKVFLREGDDFDIKDLYKSVKEINKLKIFEPITDQDISWVIDKEKKQADFVFYFKEKKKTD
ncbi:MAG TPA: M15 family metallopeptidase [Pyrinomonadaceae bacterium]|jgi:D-alanyl-D-alanine dipeptidase|nr:M15 family metallopeptidase [Pyrinomonadaceae bacterium]